VVGVRAACAGGWEIEAKSIGTSIATPVGKGIPPAPVAMGLGSATTTMRRLPVTPMFQSKLLQN
jgi:hypothetical protein